MHPPPAHAKVLPETLPSVHDHAEIQDPQHSFQRTIAFNTIGPNSPDA